MEPSETFSLAETMLELAIGTEGAVKPQKKYFRQVSLQEISSSFLL